MKAFNAVRFRVKPGFEASFVEHHRNLTHQFEGFLGGSMFQTGDRSYCLIGAWRDYDAIAAARPKMIASLDQVRHMLEELDGGVGVTDPVSGTEVATLAPSPGLEPATPKAPARRKAARRKAKPAAKKRSAKKKAAKKKAAKKKVSKKAATKKKPTKKKATKKKPARKKAKKKAGRRGR